MASLLPPKPKARQNLVKRACDPCKVRKIKCSEHPPCTGCIAAGIECTFKRSPLTRGPRTLRARTIDRIAKECSTVADSSQGDLAGLLDIYAERLFPIWPILDARELKRQLTAEPREENAHHLAQAVALATVAQLNLRAAWSPDVELVERDVQKASLDLLDSLRVSFYLHIYHENQQAGGIKSLLYLREAITKAQILRIDREATYAQHPEPKQQLLRRVLWLLFVTERGVAMLHKLPVVLRPNILRPNVLLPCFAEHSETSAPVLPAFLKLVHLFWTFDQSGIFELLRNADTDVSSMESLARGCLELLQQKLTEEQDEATSGNDVQRADMLVTRQWMRAVLWRAALRFGVVAPGLLNPIDVASEFLGLVSALPMSALESQGPTLEFKTYEIATAVVDAVADSRLSFTFSSSLDRPKDVLAGLHAILSSSRGGNKTLINLLNARMAACCPDLKLFQNPSPPRLMGQDAWDFLEGQGMTSGFEGEELAWPPLDLGNLLRSPSPLTRMLLEQPRAM
ncbi:uncharacterized protein J7T54_002551 [Emericellopsis cladophorae]|uniref:Zn(2)-C6 fungal-type domain-containing protein n=1 Tax=Emericellopsis cladophorae TaxID=2686198 RepID=A0A9P9Y0N8_9HYPO|nr:uncharacterized protein J7T54_002551 [Emericellopsis cladophorae]KAI6781195.1 hypothetical protein J7T54_002551 [Emericellopsis cladophorae]